MENLEKKIEMHLKRMELCHKMQYALTRYEEIEYGLQVEELEIAYSEELKLGPQDELLDFHAADLYLEYWRLDERPNDLDIANGYFKDHPKDETGRPLDNHGDKIPNDAQAEKRKAEIIESLTFMEYPSPEDIIYDNDSIPHIEWKTEGFDCGEYYLKQQ